ncbi:hypothetical protein MATL_G00124400 [Megalops atlanticus]|uniref:ZP-N domain-containing protein n=1 Tax=Megalops atlanticus TaxID=7932 RepID=A0A9D3PWS0_MEGAT|nr:hypothetical protein MATL_G00124400 [Megalops atlanticus]
MWPFCLSTCFLSVLFSPVSAETALTADGWGSQGPHDRLAEQHLYEVREHEPAHPVPRSSRYHLLPMSQHASAPLVDRQLFRPSVEGRPLPNIVKNLLLPPPPAAAGGPAPPASNPRGVEVWCGRSTVSVRVSKKALGFRTVPSMLYLGTCAVRRFSEDYYYFHNNLHQCGATQTTVDGWLVYSNTLRYVPEPQGLVLRALPLALPIHCSYARWEELYGVASVCSCCDSPCEASAHWPSSLSLSPRALVTSDSWRVVGGAFEGPLLPDEGGAAGGQGPLPAEGAGGVGLGAESVQRGEGSVRRGVEADEGAEVQLSQEEVQLSQKEVAKGALERKKEAQPVEGEKSVERVEEEPAVWQEDDRRPDQDEE